MIDYKNLFENESVEDIAIYLIPGFSYQHVDRWFVRYNFDVIANGLLLRTTEKLLREGKLSEDEKGHINRGPNWQAPQFVKDKKYGIE